VDFDAAIRANNYGVGLMEHLEQTEFPKAAVAFEEAIAFAPDWITPRINLGIALLNQAKPEPLARAIDVLKEVLEKEPANPHANYCLGIIYNHTGDLTQAAPYFEKVTEADPTDAMSWYFRGHCAPEGDSKKIEYYQKAVELDPYLSAAVYSLAMDMRAINMDRARQFLAEQEDLKKAMWDNFWKDKYDVLGHYAQAIVHPLPVGAPAEPATGPKTGPIPLFSPEEPSKVKLASGTRWASAADLGTGAVGDLHRLVRQRFGGTIAVFDYNGDKRLDILMLGAVVENGKLRDLLLRNEGEGRFVDVTAEAGLVSDQPSLGCAVGDFDNDGRPDLFITGAGKQRLLRNNGKGKFDDVTAEAKLHTLKSVCLGCGFLDLDQDGDLDLVVAQVGNTPEEALAALRANQPVKGPGLAVFINTGESAAAIKTEDPPPLPPRFERIDRPRDVLAEGLATNTVTLTDIDGDRDLDLIITTDHHAPQVIANDRLLRFHITTLPPELASAGKWNGALPIDVANESKSDLLLIGPGQKTTLLLNAMGPGHRDVTKGFSTGTTNGPSMIQAEAVDLDLDGWCDVVGLSDKRQPVVLHNDGKRLLHEPDKLGLDSAWPKDLLGIAVADFNGDGYPDFVVWSESAGLRLHVNMKNSNRGLFLDLTGHRHVGIHGEPMRSNNDAIGATARAHAGRRTTSAENATRTAGLGQSRKPIVLGLGDKDELDVVRFRWPDLVIQAEFGLQPGQVCHVDESQRRDTSCPVLFTWNGERYVFVTDFLGAGSMGELGADGTCRPPRPEESVKVEADQLVPVDGQLRLIASGPMSEVIYLDHLQLNVLDHPADVRVYPDERFAATGPPPTQDLLAFRQEIFPVRARDHRGRDVAGVLRHWDRQMVDDFRRRGWVGFAEDHWVELDFGDRLAKFGPKDPLALCLAGWTDYAFPESIYAAGQAGVDMQFPSLERLGADGKWQTVLPDIGIPAGLPRMMTVNVTGKLGGPSCVIRVRSNLHVFWDQIFIAPLVQRTAADSVASSPLLRLTPLEVAKATLASPGCAQEYTPDGKPPTLYDHDRIDSVPSAQLRGYLTRTGDVTELLKARDDCLVIYGPGDEVRVAFDASRLPPLPAGWKRSYVLRTWGYSKDPGPFTATNETIEPLPFAKMSRYPYGTDEHYPTDPAHAEYRRKYNTRRVGD
jgi:Tfp pilus assembly protein PilF